MCYWLRKLPDMAIVRARPLKAATFSLCFLLLAVASACAQTLPKEPHDFISWLRQVGSTGTQRPRAPIGAHHLSPPLPRPQPAELAAVAPQAEPASAGRNTAKSEAAHEQELPTSPAAADNTLAEPT